MKVFVALILLSSVCVATVIMTHADLNQTGSFTDTILTTSNVSASTFGKISKYSIDVPVFAQPIIVSGVVISGVSKNLLIQATMTNRIYAFDANSPALIWKTILGDTREFIITGGISNLAVFTDLGVLSTPAADQSINSLFVVAAGPNSWDLYKLSLVDGTVQSRTAIAGQVTGTGDVGDTVIGGKLQFSAKMHYQRPGLVVANGKVYIAFGSIADNRPWHGWIFAYNESDLSQAGVFCTTPSSYGGAIWQAGGAPSVDGNGNIYVTTGNDNSVADGVELGESVLKLSPTLSLLDYFQTATHASLDTTDSDISSGRAILIPGTNPQKIAVAGKDFMVYIIDSSCMGHLQGSNLNCALQSFKTDNIGIAGPDSGAYGSTFDSNVLYVPTVAGNIYAYPWDGSAFNTISVRVQTSIRGLFGPAQMSASNGILWVVTTSANADQRPAAATLRAIRESDFTEIWNSDQTAGDTLGHIAKFVSPLIYNGNVYVPNQDGQIQVYGLH